MPLRLNLCCGNNKIDGAVNVDVEPSVKPDLICDISKPLPWKDEEVDEVYLFHSIEHIPEAKHFEILSEIRRILKPEGLLFISYPEFERIAKNWLENKFGKRDFWKATIYGRQLYPSDFHVALMHTPDFITLLKEVGFRDIIFTPEKDQPHNTVLKTYKGIPQLTYEDVVKNEIFT